MFTCVLTVQARTKSGPWFWCAAFSCKFLYKVALVMSLVNRWHAFRLRRLSHSVCLRSGLSLGRGIFRLNFRIKRLFWCLFWDVDVHLIAQARAKCGPRFRDPAGARHFSCKFLYLKWILRHVDDLMCISTAQARRQCGPRSWLAAFYL